MPDSPALLAQIMAKLHQQLGDRLDHYTFPPPVFVAMQGEFLAYDSDQQSLMVRFPILEKWLNPYGIMQGGMVAAAIDNTIGPLSVLVAPPNVTRHMELKYSRAVSPAASFITVSAYLLEWENSRLTFKAEAHDPQGLRLVRAKAIHWILDV